MSQPSALPNMDVFMQMFLANAPRTAQDMRRMLDGFAPFMNTGLPEVGALHEAVPVREGVTADVIVPRGAGPHPVLVYLHGGGWVCGSPKTHNKLAHRFAEAGYLVFNVDYRLAPEHPFPTPFEDCLAAVRFAYREAQRFGGDAARLAVGGDSAGGNLSAAVAAALANDPARPKAALLIYGVFDFGTLGEGALGGADDPRAAAIGRDMLEMMVGAYLGSAGREPLLRDPRVSPLTAAAMLPPSHVVVGSADPLAVQAEALVKALAAAGVPHEHFVDTGMPHGYLQMEFLPAARPAIDRMVEFLRRNV
jgi:acetyl esterase